MVQTFFSSGRMPFSLHSVKSSVGGPNARGDQTALKRMPRKPPRGDSLTSLEVQPRRLFRSTLPHLPVLSLGNPLRGPHQKKKESFLPR